jgi:hypothetical protein
MRSLTAALATARKVNNIDGPGVIEIDASGLFKSARSPRSCRPRPAIRPHSSPSNPLAFPSLRWPPNEAGNQPWSEIHPWTRGTSILDDCRPSESGRTKAEGFLAVKTAGGFFYANTIEGRHHPVRGVSL